ncbi:hypothetical protein BDV59DRAFT_173550 [Aspergillus ambiguus]|uniref:uncharacterized protein n=1 Tax=Aspergillus ambiguus TaxID=176160 RepID=UPI003CCCD63D
MLVSCAVRRLYHITLSVKSIRKKINMKRFISYSLALFTACAAAIPSRGQSGLFGRAAATNSTICTNPRPNSCTFYSSCLEGQFHCGSDGYPIGYGLHYCKAFTDTTSELSTDGQAWVTKTMLCLQRALVPYGTGTKSTTCSGLKEYAFGTHPGCYVDSGVCALPPTDWAIIVDTVSLPELFGSWDALKATFQTAGGCTEFYAWLIQQGIVKVAEQTGEAIEDAMDTVRDAGESAWDWATSWF